MTARLTSAFPPDTMWSHLDRIEKATVLVTPCNHLVHSMAGSIVSDTCDKHHALLVEPVCSTAGHEVLSHLAPVLKGYEQHAHRLRTNQ